MLRKKKDGATTIYPSFEAFLSFESLDKRSRYYISHLHTPRAFLQFMSMLGKQLIRKTSDNSVRRLALVTSESQIKKNVCSIVCSSADNTCKNAPEFC
jgi:hypothetical protein